jgi:hypothetical protein
MSDFVTLVNRSSKTLQGTWDGRHYDITPGKHEFSRIKAEKFMEQNPIMGSEDKYSNQKLYLIGIVENGDDCSPIEQSKAISLEDLSDKIKSGELKVVTGNGLYSPRVDASAPLPGIGTNLGFKGA